ncbi:Uma2 family endonuclease [Streptomyces caniscabiei]|uniref:Uma2 family endonuclease n=1 Tax=Streptomyces caniscabiei TaxID=2746961 RepID=UPI000A37ACB3|nr:Uma2 family endonuclease [Streptomyces caniscabiei]MBD9703321.1 Uma2 family endonuclease [Streptomyces caniscabiei]MDX3725635.1 Uma2 family endonuclease [Streptomyces caniscabiei]
MWRATEMTAVDERGMAEFFAGFEPPDGVKMELLRGEIVMMSSPDLVHNRIVTAVQDQIPRQRWERLQTQDVDIVDEASEPVPDLVVLENDLSPETGRLLSSRLITLLVEVVSKTSVDRDYGVKRSIYAAGQVPAYLIIDPIMSQCVLLTEPLGAGDAADYQVQRITKFGDPVPLDLLGVELDTSTFGTLPGVRPHRRP